MVTTEPNEMGWCLVRVTAASRLDRADAKIVVGIETVSIRYGDQQLAPEKRSALPQGVPTPAEFTGYDAKGAYVRVWPYMSDAGPAKYLNRDVPKQVREEFLKLVHDQRDELFKASHEERAAAVKKAFESTIGK